MRANRTLRFFTHYIDKLPQLTPKEKEVLISRIQRKSLNEIGNLFMVTEGRIRQIEKTALKKINLKTIQLSLFHSLKTKLISRL